jgi:hypothetical protein
MAGPRLSPAKLLPLKVGATPEQAVVEFGVQRPVFVCLASVSPFSEKERPIQTW